MKKLLQFLHQIPCLDKISMKVCAQDLKAGKCCSDQAVRTLCAAAQSDQYFNIAKSLLIAETDINGMQDSMTPLMHAGVHGSTEILDLLLTNKATINHTNSQQETSLLLACRSKQWQTAKLLYYSGANPLCADINGQTPLEAAFTNGGVELVQYIASREPAVLHKLKEISSLSDACKFNYDMLIELYPNLSNEQINEVVSQACQWRNTDVLWHAGLILANDILATNIAQAYHAGHSDCLNTLLKCAEEKKEPHCINISLSESCKHEEFINLTKFMVDEDNVDEDNGEPLRTAAKSGNFSAVEYLIQVCHAEVDGPDTHGATALLFACMESHLDIVDILLDFGADVNVCAEETPLTAACRNGQQQIVNRLLKDEDEISTILNTENKLGVTPVQMAVNKGHTALAKNLIKKGATLPFKNVSFHTLCQLDDTGKVDAFLKACTDHQTADEKVLSTVVKANNSKLLDLLLTNGTVDKSREALQKALETAIIMGSKTIVRTLIEYDRGNIWKSMNDKPERHIHQAFMHHHPDIVELLLNQGCNLTTDSCPLVVKSNRILTLVLEHMSQPLLNEALLVACSSGHRIPESSVRLLLKKSANVNYHNQQTGSTPLLAATTIPCETIVRTLLEYGADPNDIDDDDKKNSPLFLACDVGHHAIASRLLYDSKVPVDLNPSRLPPEKCPLWISCLRGYLDLVELFANKQANLNLRNEKESLLEASHKAGQHEVVRLLLEHGADPAALSSIGMKTACHYGYAETAVAISNGATMDELSVCISEACKEGFPETGMGIIINTPDADKQKELFQALQPQQTDSRPQPSTSNDTSESQSQEESRLWQCFYNRDTKQMMKLIEEGWNPNITNMHGITLFQACMSDRRLSTVRELCLLKNINQKSLVDINQKDSLGRNILFYVLKYLKGHSEQADLFDFLLERGADIEVTDNFGRTLLHEWDPQPATESNLHISLRSFKQIPLKELLDKCDCKGQTSLHAAFLQQNSLKVQQLLDAGSSPAISDTNNICPEKISSLISSPVEVQSASFSNEYAAAHRIPIALSNLFHRTKAPSSRQLFQKTFEAPLLISKKTSFKKEFKKFCEIILQFMGDLSDDIANEDPLFAFQPVLSGSCSEGTKVVAMDKAEVLCLFSHQDWKELSVLNHEKANCTFVKLASDKFAEKYPKLVRKSCLSVHGVIGRFYGLIRKSLAKVLRKHVYNNLYIKEPHSILESTYAISALELIWCGDFFKWQEFSLDVIPAIPLTEEKIPKELNHCDLLHDIFVVPKWTASLIDAAYADEAFELGFSFPEKDLFYAMPIELRQGYMLTKVVVQHCMVIDGRPIDLYISNLMLKDKVFQCFADMPGFAERMKKHTKRDLMYDKLQPPKDILACADLILKKLEESIKIHYQESFFVKGCNLLNHSMYQEDFRPLLYMRLCRAMLQSPHDNISSWQCLAQMVAEQLVKEGHFQQESFVCEIDALQTMGLDANWRSENGTCLLYYMIKYGLVHGVQMLVDWGATPDDIDEKGRSAFQLVEEFQQPAMQKILQEHGK